MKELTTIEQVEQAKQSKTPVVLLWSANWCGDCLYLRPFLPEIEKDNPKFTFYKLDRDQLLDEAINEQILGIPSFTVWQDGKELGRFVSKDRKTPAEIQAFLNGIKVN